MTVEMYRTEMHRLGQELLALGDRYDRREKQLETQHRLGHANYSGEIGSIKRNDLLLADLSGGAASVARLMTAYASAITAELMYQETHRAP